MCFGLKVRQQIIEVQSLAKWTRRWGLGTTCSGVLVRLIC